MHSHNRTNTSARLPLFCILHNKLCESYMILKNLQFYKCKCNLTFDPDLRFNNFIHKFDTLSKIFLFCRLLTLCGNDSSGSCLLLNHNLLLWGRKFQTHTQKNHSGSVTESRERHN